ASERVGVRGDAARARLGVAHREHRAPLREPRAELPVLDRALAKTVEPLRDALARPAGERLHAEVDLDARQDAEPSTHGGERRAGGALLPDRLVLQDRARDEVAQAGRGQEHLAVIAAATRRRRDVVFVEAL